MTTASWTYAETTLMLLDDRHGPGAAAVFDTALTNGLVAIVQHDWPTRVPARGRKPSANQLLDAIEQEVGLNAAGTVDLPDGHGDTVPAAVNVFRQALRRTQPVRHGNGGDGTVLAVEVDALTSLDPHPALGTLRGATYDRLAMLSHRDDAVERSRAAAYADDLDAEETARQVELASASMPFSPKDLLDWDPPQDCPVRGHASLAVTQTDDMGYGIGPGTCSVCSYRRSARSGRHVYEAGVVPLERDGDDADGSAPVTQDGQVGLPGSRRLLPVARHFVVPLDPDHHVS